MSRSLLLGLIVPFLPMSCVIKDTCNEHTDCFGTEVCVYAECEASVDRSWVVSIDSISAGALHPDGYDWDNDLTGPDLWVEFGLSGGDGCLTSVGWDSYEPLWEEACEFYIPSGGVFVINVWEEDPDGPEFVTDFVWDIPEDWRFLAMDYESDLYVTDPSGEVQLWLWLTPVY